MRRALAWLTTAVLFAFALLTLFFAVAGAYLRADVARDFLAGNERYLPGAPQPFSCPQNVIASNAPVDFSCFVSDARHRFVLNVAGANGRITHATFYFRDIRLGDVLLALGAPDAQSRAGARWIYTWANGASLTASRRDPNVSVATLYWRVPRGGNAR